jgi:phosphoglycerol geranylgeranyltransferase
LSNNLYLIKNSSGFFNYFAPYMNPIYKKIQEGYQKEKKSFAVLVDPDSTDETALKKILDHCNEAGVDFLFAGGSLITNGYFEQCISTIKMHTNIPCVIFPGNTFQISKEADAILFLSLISGRNPELLIGNHVLSAPVVKKSGIEVIPTGYMLVDGGRITSVSYMSNTIPIPSDKHAIAASTALAGEMLGLKLIYMDAGSGAMNPIPPALIAAVRKQVSIPIIAGGGIRTEEQAVAASKAGADIVVIGNAVEKDPLLIKRIATAVRNG